MSRNKNFTIIYEIPMGGSVSDLIEDERAVCFSWSDAIQRINEFKNNIPDLTEVIDWLEAGKDINTAISELKDIQDELNEVYHRDLYYDK